MDQTIILPKVVTVLVCGPSCTGKSTLARKINETSPRASKALVSADEVMDRYAALHPEALVSADEVMDRYAALHPEAVVQMWHSIIKGNGIIREPGYERFILETCFSALGSSDLVVIEGIYVQPQQIIGHIAASVKIRGNAPFYLIKMHPSEKQHREFYNHRSEQRKMVWGEVEKQLRYFDEVLARDYAKEFPWVQQFTVDDPRTVEMQFSD